MGEQKRRVAAAATLDEQLSSARNLHAVGRLKEAQAVYHQILEIDPARVEAWVGAARIARDTGVHDTAVKLLKKAVALAPKDVPTLTNYAAALQDSEDFDAACTQLRLACTLRPTSALLWESLGVVEQARGASGNAVMAYRRALEIEPTAARQVKLATVISPIADSRETIGMERKRMAAVLDRMLALQSPPGADRIKSNPFEARLLTNFYLAYQGEGNRDLQAKTTAVYRHICPSLNYVAAHCKQPAAHGGRIRVGLISQYFRVHSIGRTSCGFFAQMSREQFEVTAIFIAPTVTDEISEAIKRHAEHTLVVPRDLDVAREQIAALQLDILFYQDLGMEPFTYYLAFARLAPVQCTSFGHPDTTGISTIDYFVSNDLFEPDGAAAHYSEKLYLLRNLGSLAYYYRPALPVPLKTRAALGLPSDRPVYLCPQSLFKVHPDMDDLIAGILRRDPHGVVVLVAGRSNHWTQLLRKRWRQTMADVQDRILFVPRMPGNDFLNLIALADVMLDTVHFNGMNTSLEAFAVGTPVVTLPAAFQRGRHTQAMYRKMGLENLISHNAQAYVEQAVRLANDTEYRSAVSQQILEKSAVLFEDALVVREFERFFLEVAHK